MPSELQLPSPAPEILDYLARHPEARDTIDGILSWWVLEACIRKWAPKISNTVALLVERGLLEESQSADGRRYYRAGRTQRRAPRRAPGRARRPAH